MRAERHFNMAVATEREPLQDHCGIVGALGPHDFLFYSRGVSGLNELQTRGHDGAGGFALASDGSVVLNHKGSGRVLEVFDNSAAEMMRLASAHMWIFQTRYGTNGDPRHSNASIQPLVRTHKKTNDFFAVAHNGEFETDDRNGPVSDSVRFADKLAQTEGNTWKDRITTAVLGEKGAYSLIIGTPDGMFLTRDPKGIRPLSYGAYWDEQTGGHIWVAASETNALSKMGISTFFEVSPGELVFFAENQNPKSVQIQRAEKPEICIFENVYTGNGNSAGHLPRTNTNEIDSAMTTGAVRRRSGEVMAREVPVNVDEVDFVIGIPGTAISGGKGFASALTIPYEQLIQDLDPENNPRKFMMPDVEGIYAEVLKGFTFNKERLKGARVVLVDDSIVRNNVMRAIVGYLTQECGVESIDVRVLCPPIEDICNRGLNTRTKDELIAWRIGERFNGSRPTDEQLTEAVRVELGVRSLAYLSLEGLKEANTNDPHDERFCTNCMRQTTAPKVDGHQSDVSVNVFVRNSMDSVVPVADPVRR